MQIVSNRKEIIFRNDYEGKPIYKIGISRKETNGTYTQSTMLCRFPKNTDLHHKTWIMIKSAWLDFYLKDIERNGKESKEAVPYIFINDYDIVDEKKEEPKQEEQESQLFVVQNLTEDDLDLPF